MDDFVHLLPQLSAGLALVAATAYAVRRILRQDDEWERIVKQKDADLTRKDTEIQWLRDRLDERSKRR